MASGCETGFRTYQSFLGRNSRQRTITIPKVRGLLLQGGHMIDRVMEVDMARGKY
jgi:hypothetical protein